MWVTSDDQLLNHFLSALSKNNQKLMSEDDKHLIICQVIVGILSNVFQIYSCFGSIKNINVRMHGQQCTVVAVLKLSMLVFLKSALDDEVLFNPWKCDWQAKYAQILSEDSRNNFLISRKSRHDICG